MDSYPRDKGTSYVYVTVVCRVRLSPNPLFNFSIFIYMKYTITENRLNRIMTNYLDSFLATKQLLSYDDSVVIADVGYAGDDDPNWTEHMFYDFNDDDLWVSNEFIEEFSNLFGKDEAESLEFIKDWFYSTVDIDQDLES